MAWIVFLAWGALGMLVARVFFTAPFDRKKLPWMKAVGEREAGGPLEGRSLVVRLYWWYVGSVRRGFGYRFLQPDPDPDIERKRGELLAEGLKKRPYFIGFMVIWLGGLK